MIKNIKIDIIIVLVIVLNILGYLFLEANSIFLLPTLHLDGAFQTASSLFRIDSGNTIGKDYFPYLGLGVIYIIYPLFKLLGASLYSSLVSANFIVFICGFLICLIICYFSSKNDVKFTLLVGILIFLSLSNKFDNLKLFDFYRSPGNSLKPVRAFLPYIIFPLYYVFKEKVKNRNENLYILSLSTLFCFSLLWSNDFAYITFVILGIAVFIENILLKRHNTLFLIKLVFTVFISFLIITYFFMKTSAIEYYKYNFLDISKDQWWLFAPYNKESRFWNISDIINLIKINHLLFPLIILSLYTIYCIFYKKYFKFQINLLIGFSLLMGGVIASVGGHFDELYFEPFNIWSYLSLVIILIMDKFKNIEYKYIKIIYNILIILTLLVSFFILIIEKKEIKMLKSELKKNDNYMYVPELGGYLDISWKDYINFIEKNKNKKIIEEYSGIWSAYAKQKKNTWRVDSVIHALGSKRNESREKIKTVDYVVTTREDFSPWQKWSFSQNFWLYDELIKKFKISYVGPSVIVWEKLKDDTVKKIKQKNCNINENSFSINETEGYFKIEIKYDIKKKSRGLILLNNNITNTDAVSLPPMSTSFDFPIYVRKKNEKFNFHFLGGIKKMNILSCTYEQINK